MSNQSTPGPWHAHHTFGNSWWISTVDTGTPIASALVQTEADKGFQADNARLIAAAPELLEMLKSLRRDDHDGFTLECYCDKIGGYGCAACGVDVAIAKAEGLA